MITAKLQGRRLVLTVETEEGEAAIPPFYVDPISAKTGRTLSARYLFVLEDVPLDEGSIGEDMIRCLGEENYARLDDELRQEEGELIMQAAYFWQLVTGMEGVRAILEGQEEGADKGKAVGLFREKMAPLLSQIRRRLESEIQTQTDGTPATSSPQGGGRPVRQPTDRQPKKPKTPKGKPKSASPSDSPPTSD